ncbi:hypothetical protein BCR33DRAFT_741422 [Rhizoclosmatium globosum]|uniref:Uncharacterized protein n=1 Tax=Rhizoclosmatium globosum TaxID=329046 RepID=A0A1Y2BWQ3_9FUNG|nr:hypothetical protein BCR33DRAFT_741422 [Rhizoclosmatium globosum]|eukprot:ORY38545.1 hypothetical protein BCR33DRAFT_741422 [Rhizoclosmatium globosum]
MKFSATLLLVTATAFQALAAPVPGDDKYYESYHKAEYKGKEYDSYEARNTTRRKVRHENKYDDAEKYYKRDGYSADNSPDYVVTTLMGMTILQGDGYVAEYADYDVKESYGDDKDNDYGYNEEYNDYDHNNKYADKYDSNDEKYYKRDYDTSRRKSTMTTKPRRFLWNDKYNDYGGYDAKDKYDEHEGRATTTTTKKYYSSDYTAKDSFDDNSSGYTTKDYERYNKVKSENQ